MIRVQDARGLFVTQAFSIQTSSATNQAPSAVDDAYAVRVNESLAIGTPGILGNDADANGATLAARLITGPRADRLASARTVRSCTRRTRSTPAISCSWST